MPRAPKKSCAVCGDADPTVRRRPTLDGRPACTTCYYLTKPTTREELEAEHPALFQRLRDWR